MPTHTAVIILSIVVIGALVFLALEAQ